MTEFNRGISIIAVSFFISFFLSSANISAQTFKIAVLPVGETERKFYERFRAETGKQGFVRLIDDDLSLSAMRALNYKTPFNLSLEEAKNLGAAIDCDFFFLVKSDSVRRSSFRKDVYFESFANIFLVSARTGKLVASENIFEEADKPEDAEKQLLGKADKIAADFAAIIQTAAAREREERAFPKKNSIFLEISAENENIRTPLPYKSLKPAYTDAAAHFEVEAAVEVAVELNASGAVENAEIVRWAGFGLDEETIKTVKKMQFRPALRGDGTAIPVRFVLRYNFRRPREKKE
ncbi:MAG: TonB family protein [Acidobacteriota bacterium]|nr:TonB family protein [Acidobacteriota bacterium]